MPIALAVVAAARHEPIHLPRIVKFRAGLNAVDKVIILLSGPYRDRRRAEDETHLAVGDTVDIIVEPAPRVAANRKVARRHHADRNEYKDSGYNENLFPHKQITNYFRAIKAGSSISNLRADSIFDIVSSLVLI